MVSDDPRLGQHQNTPELLLLAAIVDDGPPGWQALLFERLAEAGALDAYLTPAIASHGRPVTTINVVVRPANREAIEHLLIEQTSTFHVDVTPLSRTSATAAWETVATRWGDVRLKLKIWRGRVIDAIPEDGDCVDVARRADAPLQLVHAEAQRLGDVFVGLRRE
jgi:pyridinium-3,5-bisthiocarboxylic acid mononucleotide nickel chelatase